jgi:hypothetical protein
MVQWKVPCTLNLGYRCMVTFKPRPLYLHTIGQEMDANLSNFGLCGDEELLPLPGTEPGYLGCPAHRFTDWASPTLCNAVACRAVSRQGLGKHVPVATDTHATTEVVLETVFYPQSVQRGYKEVNWIMNSSDENRCAQHGMTVAPDGVRHQDRLTDWLSVAIWLWLWRIVQLEKSRHSQSTWTWKQRSSHCWSRYHETSSNRLRILVSVLLLCLLLSLVAQQATKTDAAA